MAVIMTIVLRNLICMRVFVPTHTHAHGDTELIIIIIIIIIMYI